MPASYSFASRSIARAAGPHGPQPGEVNISATTTRELCCGAGAGAGAGARAGARAGAGVVLENKKEAATINDRQTTPITINFFLFINASLYVEFNFKSLDPDSFFYAFHCL